MEDYQILEDTKNIAFGESIYNAFKRSLKRNSGSQVQNNVILRGKTSQDLHFTSQLFQLNRILLWTIGFFSAFLIVYTALFLTPIGSNHLLKPPMPLTKNKAEGEVLLVNTTSFKSANHYLDIVTNRNIFSSTSKDQYDQLRETKDLKQEIEKIFTVVGLLKDIDSKVIIEDKKNKETHFLSEGQEFKGIKILHINEESVTVEYHNSKIALSP